ncbi:FHA domain-containing protein [Paraburkholderia saeva]|uniref:FHA domain-containing protein n=1 Tax=Paraburkholderia saeva TaxID=2777537 RepID=UPI001DC94FFC|nr:FHA domain-containing protein [Paraburkholderia saeva]CAG4913666.1 hypothetical protein R52603_04154 [Paraburkholderia saeva]
MTPGEAQIAEVRTTLDQAFDVVLSPVSHPALGAIRIIDSLFAIGRSEPPFVDYPRELLTRLSRRHARIFTEHGVVYVADLESKNGTTLNGKDVRQTPGRVRAGDELCFGGELSYRVGIEPRARIVAAAQAAQPAGLTLVPERGDLGLLPIDVRAFPFLISKADDVFARYKERYPHQVNYISRRHAHIFVRAGDLYVEDLGSTNGTFVNGRRLDESAHALQEGDVLAFGGDHFVYRVELQPTPEFEPTVTQMIATPPIEEIDADKTTFVGAAHSFLDIFCVDQARQREDEVNEATRPDPDDTKRDTRPHRVQRRWRVLATELSSAFSGGERLATRRAVWCAIAGVVVVAGIGVALYLRGASERELKNLLAAGDYEEALSVANDDVRQHPADVHLKALASEALMKAKVPDWLAALQKREFDRADSLLGNMKTIGAANPDAVSLVGELRWVGDLERFVVGRGGPDAPIRIYADEGKISDLLRRWDDDARAHQRALDRIASYVPAFADPYAQALSHLRKLQSDDSVYLAAIDRLNTTINTELARDKPDALPPVLDDYAQRYPRLAGLDRVRGDLKAYTELLADALARKLTPLLAAMKSAHFSTPPFNAQYARLAASRLPSADVIQRHDAATAAWQRGDGMQTLAALQAIPANPWSDVLTAEQTHKRAVLDQYADLQKSRGTKGYDERLLSFYAALDPAADTWFMHAIEADVTATHDKALARAQDLLTRAQAEWRQYRANGSIGGTQRLESGISGGFRSQAHLLSDAQSLAQQGMRIYTQLKADHPSDWDTLLADINAEADMQRRSLQELRMVLEPELLKSKLALIGGDSSETRQSP